MQKIIVIGGGAVAMRFLERLKGADTDNVSLEIVLTDNTKNAEVPKNAVIHSFDATSEYRMKELPLREARMVFVALDDMEETKTIIRLIRQENMSAGVVAIDSQGLDTAFIDEHKIKAISTKDVLSNTLMSFMPNIPLIAQNIGKGQGEIMEVMVPYGSKYVFRHISNIEQKNWKIAAIYRNEQLILPKQSTMIRPQDELILMGQPNILRDVYKAIKSELGHFPQPFGANLYLALDLLHMPFWRLKQVMGDTLRLHEGLNGKKLFVKAIKPNDAKAIEYLRQIKKEDVIIEIDYSVDDLSEVIKEGVKRYNIGLVLLDRTIFRGDVKKTLFELKKAVLKFGKRPLFEDSYSAVFLSENIDLEKISYVFFDMSLQLKLPLKLLDYDPEGADKNAVAEHYVSLADVYSTKIQIVKEQKNFLREHKSMGNFIQFLPFTEELLELRLRDFFIPANNRLFTLLKDNHQIFIPISD